MNRRGVALAEALVAVLLTALLVATSLGALAALQRALERQVVRTTRVQTLRAAVQLTVAELQDLSPPAGDLISLTSGAVVYRVVRATGLGCGANSNGLLVRSSSFRALRTPAAGRDSLAVLVGANQWTRVGLTAAPRSGVCPDGSAAIALPYAVTLPDPYALVTWPAPVTVSEIMELRGYQSGAEWWLGLRSVSAGETIQPALGPLGPNGMRLLGLDSLGVATSSLSEVRQLTVSVRLDSGDSVTRSLALSPGAWP